jgi:hypothetical protein
MAKLHPISSAEAMPAAKDRVDGGVPERKTTLHMNLLSTMTDPGLSFF